MNQSEILDRFKKILFNPVSGWNNDDLESLHFKDVISPYFILTTVILFVVRFVGKSLKYLSSTDIWNIVMYSVISLIVDFLFFFIVVFAVNSILPSFHIKKSKTKVATIVYMSLVPFYFSLVILNLFPSLFFLGLIFLYGFYILYWGIVKYLEVPKENINIVIVLFSLIIIGVYLILNFLMVYPFFEYIF